MHMGKCMAQPPIPVVFSGATIQSDPFCAQRSDELVHASRVSTWSPCAPPSHREGDGKWPRGAAVGYSAGEEGEAYYLSDWRGEAWTGQGYDGLAPGGGEDHVYYAAGGDARGEQWACRTPQGPSAASMQSSVPTDVGLGEHWSPQSDLRGIVEGLPLCQPLGVWGGGSSGPFVETWGEMVRWQDERTSREALTDDVMGMCSLRSEGHLMLNCARASCEWCWRVPLAGPDFRLEGRSEVCPSMGAQRSDSGGTSCLLLRCLRRYHFWRP